MKNKLLKILTAGIVLMAMLASSITLPVSALESSIVAEELRPNDERIVDALESAGYNIKYIQQVTNYNAENPNAITCFNTLTGEYISIIGTIPRVTSNGEAIDTKWYIDPKIEGRYIAGNNIFTAMVTGDILLVADENGSLSYSPKMSLNNIESKVTNIVPTLLENDPTTKYYKYNTLVWDYGICKRYTSIYEYAVKSYWVFETDPKGEVKLEYITYTNTIELSLDSEYKSAEKDTIAEVITAEQFSKATYPFIVNDTVDIYKVSTYDLRRTGAENWATKIAGNGNDVSDSSGSFFAYSIQPSGSTNNWYSNARGNITFNISSYASYNITGANLVVCPISKQDVLGITPSVNVFQGSSNNGVCSASDYQSIGTTAFSTAKTWANQLVDFNYVTFALNSSALTYLNSAANYVDFGFKSSYDYNAIEPSWSSGSFYSTYWSLSSSKSYLTISYTVPPSVGTEAASNVEETTARANGYLYSTGGATTAVTVYWGDNDGGTAAGSWDNNYSLGNKSAGSFYYNLSNLAQGTTYYYNFKAVNSIGTVWGSSVSFVTKPNEPTSLDATRASSSSIALTWTKGTGATNTYIVVKIGSYPTSRTDGTVIYNSTGTSYTHTGLTAGNTYCYRAWSVTAGAYSDSYTSDYLLLIGEPSISTSAATLVEETTARLNGNLVSTGGATTTVTVYWGDNDGGTTAGNWDYNTNLGNKSAGSFYYNLSNLTQGTTYYYNFKAVNSIGTVWGSSVSFVTKPNEPTGLTATKNSDTSISLSWTKGAGATNTYIRVKTTGYPSNTSDGTLIYSGTASTYTYTGLTAGTTYYFRAWSYTTSYSDSYSSDSLLLVGNPSVTSGSATNITDIAARLNGNLTGNGGLDTTVTVYYGDNDGGTTAENWDYNYSFGVVGVGALYYDITGLDADTTYYYRFKAVNSQGTTWASSTSSFSTYPEPAITIVAASQIAKTSARLNASISEDGNLPCQIRWGYGTTSQAAIEDYDTYTSLEGSYSAGNNPYLDITSLVGSTKYYYRVEITNGNNTNLSDELSFETISAVSAPSNLRAYPSSKSINLVWNMGEGSSNTLIRYKTNAFPNSTTDGTLAYLGSDNSYTITGLSSGKTYFISIWGESDGEYSSMLTVIATTTEAGVGGDKLEEPAQPSRWDTTPNYSNLDGMPFYDAVNDMADSLNMPYATFWMLLATFISTALGIAVYIRFKLSALIAVAVTTGCLIIGWVVQIVPFYIPLMSLIICAALIVGSRKGYLA